MAALTATLVPAAATAFTPAAAAEGDLDLTYGGGDGLASLAGFSGVGGMATMPDGRVVVAGGNGADTVVARFNADGTLDTSFNAPDGFRVESFDPANDYATSVAVLDDGTVIVAGEQSSPAIAKVYLASIPSDGTPPTWEQPIAAQSSGYTLGGYVDVSEGPVQQIYLGVWNEGSFPATLYRFDSTGTVDSTFNGGAGRSDAPFGARTVIQDLDYRDGRVVMSGHVASGSPNDGWVARFDAATGALDSTFSGDGLVTVNMGAASGDDHASAVTLDSQGRVLVAGWGQVATASFARFDSTGILDDTFGAAGFTRTDAFQGSYDILTDDADRAYVATQQNPSTFGVLRLTPDGAIDTSYSGDGYAQAPDCSNGSARVALQPVTGRPLVVGACSGSATVARFEGAAGAPGGIDNLALTVNPGGDRAAQVLDQPLDAVTPAQRALLAQSPAALAALQASPLRNTPLRNTPLRNTPLRNTPLRNTPLRNTPLRNTPLRNTALPPVLLSEVPLLRPGGWSAILDDPAKLVSAPELLGQPPQSVTFTQLPDEALAGITLEDVDLSATPLRNTSVVSTLFGLTALQDIPTPGATPWCDILSTQPFNCSNGVDVATTSLADLEVGGDSLAALLGQPLPIYPPRLHPDSPLLDVRLADLNLEETPIGSVRYDAVPPAQVASLFDCGPTACPPEATLAEMQTSDTDDAAVAAGATLATVFDALPFFELSFGQLLLGMVPIADLPYEEIPLPDLLRLQARDSATYRVEWDIACADTPGMRVDLDLPEGFDPRPGTEVLWMGSIEPWQSAGPAATVLEDGNVVRFEFGDGSMCDGPTEHFALEIVVDVLSSRLDIHEAAATVSSASTDGATVTGAEMRFTDGEGEGDQPIASDTLYSGFISQAGDVDGFSMPAPPEGSLVEVFLSHLPADYDLVLYGSAHPDATPLRNTPLRNTPLRNTPLRNTPVGDDGVDAAVGGTADTLMPETLQDVPLRNTPLRNTSIHRDLSTEVVSTRIIEADEGHELAVQVSGYNGAWSPEPYVLRVKVTPPEGDLECMAPRSLTGGVTGSLPATSAVASTTKTLFLVNQSRLGALYSPEDATTVTAKLQSLAARSDVQGAVLSVDGDPAVRAAYAAWDAEPCSVERANDVVASVNAVVDSYRSQLAELRHIVLVGSDDALPLARIADMTTLSNQRDYRADAALGGVDNPISRAFARGFMLTDDPYGDFDPSEWLGSKLFLPDVGLGRLVETPAQIIAAVDRFVAANGRLDLSSSFTAGYDFLKDGATEVDAALRQRGSAGPRSLIDDTWGKQAVIDAWSGQSTALDGTTTPAAAPRAVSVNAHYDHYRALPALGDSSGDAHPDLLTTADLASSGLPTGALLFGMGCQGGLNIPDVFAAVGDPKAADWAQTAAGKGALYAGNTGYGYGDTDVAAYSERVYSYFAEGLDGATTVGQAMTLAKHRYLRGLGVAGVYDAKAVQEAVFYGLPMYRLGTAGSEGAAIMPTPASPAPPTTSVTEVPFDTAPDPVAVTTPDRGTYYAIPGVDPQVTHYRPIQPRLEVPVATQPGMRAHGAVLEEITTRDVSGAVDPVYALPTRDLSANEPEPTIEAGIFPTTLQNITFTATSAGLADTLVLLPGQFFNLEGDGLEPGLGVQRLFTNMDGTVLHSDSDDFVPPTIHTVEAATIDGSAVFEVTVDDPAATRVVALYLDDQAVANGDGSYTWRRVELTPTAAGRWLGFGPLATGSVEVSQWMVQAVDGGGNVGVSTNKGRYFDGAALPDPTSAGFAITVDGAPRPDGTYAPGVGVSLSDEPTVGVERSVDGGGFEALEPDQLPVTFTAPGVHTVAYRGADGSSAQITLLVTEDAPMAVNVTVPAEGQELRVGATIAPEYKCVGTYDTCTGPAQLDTSPGTHTATFTVTGGGQSVSETRTYVVKYLFTGFHSPVDNPPTLNVMKAGSTAPAKFTLQGTQATDVSLASVTGISSHRIECPGGSSVDTLEVTSPEATSSLKYDATTQQFTYNWKTNKVWARTCRMLVFSLADGTTRHALFHLKG